MPDLQTFRHIKTVISKAFDNESKSFIVNNYSLTTGFRDLDELLCGLKPANLCVVASYTTMGKTTFVLNIARHVADEGHKSVGIFTLGTSTENTAKRMLCAECSLDIRHLENDYMEKRDWIRLVHSVEKLSLSSIFIDESIKLTVSEIRLRAKELKFTHGISLLIIDGFQLLCSERLYSQSNKNQELIEISKAIKELAIELNIPIIVTSQIPCSKDTCDVRLPALRDLQNTGLDENSDIVLFLCSEDYYNTEPQRKGITNVIVAKHRNGPTDTIDLFFHKWCNRFNNLKIDTDE